MYMDICELEDIVSKSVFKGRQIRLHKNGIDVFVYYEDRDNNALYGVAHHPWSLLVEAERWMRNELGIDGIHTIDDVNEWLDYMSWENDFEYSLKGPIDRRVIFDFYTSESQLINAANAFLKTAKKKVGCAA